MTALTPNMKTLARLLAGARPSTPCQYLNGSGCGPFLTAGRVYVGQNFLWQKVMQPNESYEQAILRLQRAE